MSPCALLLLSYRMEDVVQHMQRVTTGLAAEAAKRIVAANPGADEDVVRSVVKQILLDWFMGEFPWRQQRQGKPEAEEDWGHKRWGR